MKLIQVDFNKIAKNGFIGLAIMEDGKCLFNGFIDEVLKSIPHLKNREIKEQRSYFNEWVIELK